jgi:transcriptional regulator PpsR
MTLSPNNLSNAIESIDSIAAAELVSHVADTVLVMDQNGIIENVLNTQTPGFSHLKQLIGKSWVDSATLESRKKIEALLSPTPPENAQKWRQINLTIPNSPDLPLMVSVLHLKKDNKILGIGRDLRNLANLQQRLVEAQQAIETDYLRLRFAEARYRQLFDLSTNAHIIIDGSTFKIMEVNSVAQNLMADKGKRMVGRSLAEYVDMNDFSQLQELLNSSRNINSPKKANVKLVKNTVQAEMSVNFLREENQTVFLINVTPLSDIIHDFKNNPNNDRLINAIQFSTDAFVITNLDGKILSANQTFVEMAQVEKSSDLIDEPIDNWLGRASIDLRVILNNLKDKTSLKHYITNIIPSGNSTGIEVEVSAVRVVTEDESYIGFNIRQISQRVSQRGQASSDLKQTATKLTELVGRVPLKDIVSETTDMIEKMCIMSALELTMNNRVSASEMLGLSRQSLYIKMRRFGISDPNGSEDL